MPYPAFQSYAAADVSSGSNDVTIPAPDGVTATDYQLIVLLMASSSVSLPAASAWESQGWALLANQALTPDSASGSGSARVALFEIAPDATLAQRQAAFQLLTANGTGLTGNRVWGAIRARCSIPSGSAGRTAALGQRIEATGTAGTEHPLPTTSTVTSDSLVLGVGVSDQHTASAQSQTWTSTGTFTQRANETLGNLTEMLAITLADLQVASPAGGITTTFETETPDEAGLFTVVLNGYPVTGDPVAGTRGFLPILLGG